MVTADHSGRMIGRPEHLNSEKAEENDIKYNFKKMIESLKEEMKNSLKEMRKRQTKNVKNQWDYICNHNQKNSGQGRKYPRH